LWYGAEAPAAAGQHNEAGQVWDEKAPWVFIGLGGWHQPAGLTAEIVCSEFGVRRLRPTAAHPLDYTIAHASPPDS